MRCNIPIEELRAVQTGDVIPVRGRCQGRPPVPHDGADFELPDVTLEASLEREVLVRPHAGGAIAQALITVSGDPL
jgi:hypothetical protein